MSDDRSSGVPFETAGFAGDFGRLLDFAQESPREALPEIDRFARAASIACSKLGISDRRGPQGWGPHLLYFLAFGMLATEEPGSETRAFCERALIEYRMAVEAAEDVKTEEYEETVVLRPASFFRKAATKVEKRQRTIRTSEFDTTTPDVVRSVDAVVERLRELAPDRAYEILGYVKLKDLITSNRAFFLGPFTKSVETGEISHEDLRKIGELHVRSEKGVVRSVIVMGVASGGWMLALSKSLEPIGAQDPGIIATGLLCRKGEGWEVRRLAAATWAE